MEGAIISYEKIAEVTSQILAAARDKEWHKIPDLEAQCAVELQKLKAAEKAPLAGAELQRKIASIHKILAHDREIRDLLNPWMKQMDALFKRPAKQEAFLKPPM